MPAWDGNNYNRNIHLPKFLKALDPKELQRFGKKKKDKSFMTNYGYSSYDKDMVAKRADTPISASILHTRTRTAIQLTEPTFQSPTGKSSKQEV